MKLKFLSILLFVLAFCSVTLAQGGGGIPKIQTHCPGSSRLYSNVTTLLSGDIRYIPCAGFASIFYGNVDFTNATVTGLSSGTGTTNHVTRWINGPAGILGDTPQTWDGTTFYWSPTAGTSNFDMLFRPDTAAAGIGSFILGGSQTQFNVTQGSGIIGMAVPDITGQVSMANHTGDFQFLFGQADHVIGITQGTLTAGGTPYFNHTATWNNGIAKFFNFRSNITNTASLATSTLIDLQVGGVDMFSVLRDGGITQNRTITAGGTTGAQTINKPNGSVNFAAAATSLVVTDNLVSTTSLIIATAQTNDATCFVANSVVAAGSFTIRMSAPCTAETKVAFWVWN